MIHDSFDMNKIDRHVPVYVVWQRIPDTGGIELNYFYRIIYSTVTYEMQEEFSEPLTHR